MADPTLYADLIGAADQVDEWLERHPDTDEEVKRSLRRFRDGAAQLEEALATEMEDGTRSPERAPFWRRFTPTRKDVR